VRFSLAELARRIGAEVAGDPAREVGALRTLAEAGPDDLSFLTGARYLEAARRSRAGALLVGTKSPALAVDRLIARDPHDALASLVELFHPPAPRRAGVHPTAVIDPESVVDPSAGVGPYAVVARGATVAAGASIGAHVVVGERCLVGEGVVLHPHVVLYPGVTVGAGTEVHAGTVLGADGFGYASSTAGHRKIPQVGTVTIGERVEIGALSAIDRAMLGATTIGDGTKIDNLVQVGHNVEVGRHAILCGQVGIAGSARLGDGVVLGGQSGVGGHIELGNGVQVASKSAVYEPVAAGTTMAGIPAAPIGRWRRSQAWVGRLGELVRRVRALERRVGVKSGEAKSGVDEGGEEER
jgi:UDP-3-O-[3-hydroxymyristoyl] glucosamine N-acyltransferase